MLNYSHVNIQYPMVLTSIAPVAVDLPFHELLYSPALLLPLPALSSAIVCDSGFAAACESGYDGYFEEMFTDIDNNSSFTPKHYTHAELSLELREDLAVFLSSDDYPLSWWAGFYFGWLSALSKYQFAVAQSGVLLLVALVQ